MNKVSILIYAHNVQSTIWKCIRSAALQTFKEIEIIVLDDNSTDKTKKVLKKVKERYPMIQVIERNIYHTITPKQQLLSVSKGEWVCYVDAKDELSFTAVDKMIKMTVSKDVDMVIGGYQEKRHVLHKNYRYNKIRYFNKKVAYKEILKNKQFNCDLSGKLIKKTLLNTVLFENQHFEDKIWMTLLVSSCKQIVAIPELIYYYKTVTDKKMIKINSLNYEEYIYRCEYQNSIILEQYPQLQKYCKSSLRKCYIYVMLNGSFGHEASKSVIKYSFSNLVKCFTPFFKVKLE